MGLLVHHVSNFRFIQNKVQFSNFIVMSSNEMLVKPGVADHVKKHKNGFQAVFRHQRPTWHLFNRFQLPGHRWGDQGPHDFDFVKNPEYIVWESDCPEKCPDKRVSTLMRELGWSELIGGQTEGQFYEHEVFEEIADNYERIWGEEQVVGYETEEFIPMMVAKSILKKRGEKQTAPITLQNYSQHIAYNKELIEKIKNNEKIHFDDRTNPVCLCSPHIPPSLYCPNHENWCDSYFIYSLKRVPRIYEDSTRSLIRSYYE